MTVLTNINLICPKFKPIYEQHNTKTKQAYQAYVFPVTLFDMKKITQQINKDRKLHYQ